MRCSNAEIVQVAPGPAIAPLDERAGAVLIDLDGTILDTAGEIAEAVNRMLADYCAAPLPLPQIRGFIGRGVPHLMGEVLRVADGKVDVSHSEALARFEVHYAATNGTCARVYPGVIAGLEGLRADGWKLGCVTNKPNRFVEPLLERLGLRKYFGCVVCGDSLLEMKPSPLPLLHACSALGADPAQSIMVGDSLHDVEAARAAGMRLYVVPYGYSGKLGVTALPPERLIAALDQLPALLGTQFDPS